MRVKHRVLATFQSPVKKSIHIHVPRIQTHDPLLEVEQMTYQ